MIAGVADGLTIGPVLMGMAKSTHVLPRRLRYEIW
jgi:phosphotransacetylase